MTRIIQLHLQNQFVTKPKVIHKYRCEKLLIGVKQTGWSYVTNIWSKHLTLRSFLKELEKMNSDTTKNLLLRSLLYFRAHNVLLLTKNLPQIPE